MAETEGHAFSRPGGTRAGAGDNPALKRRAIVALSLRDEAGATPKTATGTGALPGKVPAGRPMAVWDGRTGQRAFEIVSREGREGGEVAERREGN
jgi:hypothetical protein